MRVLSTFVLILARAISLAILARVLLSWLPISRENRLVALVYELTEPILEPIRRLVPPVGGLDLAPLIALLLVQMLQVVLGTLLGGLA